MSILQSIVLGIVEGATEFLPISSTAHLIIFSKLLNINQSDFVKSFEIIIQFGAILSVLVLYYKEFLVSFEIQKRIFVAFIPTAVIGFLLYKIIKTIFFESLTTILFALFIGGIIIILFEKFFSQKIDANDSIAKLPYSKCFMIGVFQSLAVIPGVSRSAATIIGGLSLNIKRTAIVEFSFLLAVPTMLAASVLDILKSAPSFSADQFGVLTVGFVVSFVVALLSIKFLINFVKKQNFIPFGIYRIIISIIFSVFMFFKLL